MFSLLSQNRSPTIQVTYAARDVGVEVVSENALPFLDRVGYNKILDNAKPLDDPDGRYLSSFIYNKLTPLLLERHNLVEFERFVKRMHGKALVRFFSLRNPILTC